MTAESRGRRFRYTWSRTWPDKPEDYACADGEVKVGRVYRIAACPWWCGATV